MWLTVKSLVFMLAVTGRTCRAHQEGEEIVQKVLDQHGNFILAVWHETAYFATWLLRDRGMQPMISQSRDGECITQVMEHFGFKAARGSSNKHGKTALLQMVRMLKGTNPGAITTDGPKGPLHYVKPGVITLAKLTGLPIIPWHYEAKRFKAVRSWDSHRFPMPFTQTFSRFGEPIYVPKKAKEDELEQCRQKVENSLTQLVTDMKKLAGLPLN